MTTYMLTVDGQYNDSIEAASLAVATVELTWTRLRNVTAVDTKIISDGNNEAVLIRTRTAGDAPSVDLIISKSNSQDLTIETGMPEPSPKCGNRKPRKRAKRGHAEA